MAGISHKGWTKGGKFEAVGAAVLLLLLLSVDVLLLSGHAREGTNPPLDVLVIVLALNVLILALVVHWGRLASSRTGFWVKVYPLKETTVLDAVVGYFDEVGLKAKGLGERHYVEAFSDIFKCLRPAFEVRIRAVSFPTRGVAVHVGRESRGNRKRVWAFIDGFDDFLERDLREGIPEGRSVDEEE